MQFTNSNLRRLNTCLLINLLSSSSGYSIWVKETLISSPELFGVSTINIKSNREFAKLAIEKMGENLQYASDELRGDILLCEIAIKSNIENFTFIHPELIESLELTKENCIDKLKSPSPFKVFKLMAMSKAQKIAQEKIKSKDNLESRSSIINKNDSGFKFALMRDAAVVANLNLNEMETFKSIIATARKINSRNINSSSFDFAEARKIIENNVPLLLENYSKLSISDRDNFSSEISEKPSESLKRGLLAAKNKLEEIYKRNVNSAKRSIAMEADVLDYTSPTIDDDNDNETDLVNKRPIMP